MSQDISQLMEEGRELALKGESVPAEVPSGVASMLATDPNLVSPDDFLRAVYAGAIETRGWLKQRGEGDYRLFFQIASEESALLPTLPFFKSVVSAWVRFSADRASEETTIRIARACVRRLAESWALGIRARLAKSILAVSLHRIDVPAQIRAAGWLDGEILRLHPSENSFFLEKNRNTILAKALKSNDPRYPQRVSQTLPLMIEALRSLVDRMRTSTDAGVLEAAEHLGGAPDTKRRGNFGSVVNHAVASGRLMDYVREVENRFADGGIVREIEAAINRLGGKSGQGAYLQANKFSIISRSLHHGIDNYESKLAKALGKLESKQKVRLKNLETENLRLKSLVAELMLDRD